MKLRFKDYRILRDAEIEIKGLTVIRGENDAGKSCVMRGLRAMVRNDSGDGHINYNASDFLVSASPSDDLTIDYTRVRNGAGAYVIRRAGQDPEHFTKLNRKDLATVFPESPFSLFAFTDSKFTPNFVFQKEIPVWGQVDAYAFFSSMFAPIASLSEHILKVRKEVSQLNEADVKGSAELNVLAEQIAASQNTLAALSGEALKAAAEDAAKISAALQSQTAAQLLSYQQEQVLSQYSAIAARADWIPVLRSTAADVIVYAGIESELSTLSGEVQSLATVQGSIQALPSEAGIEARLQAAQSYLLANGQLLNLSRLANEVHCAGQVSLCLTSAQAATQGMAADLGTSILYTLTQELAAVVHMQSQQASLAQHAQAQESAIARHSEALAGIDICSLCLRPLKPGELIHAHIGDTAYDHPRS